MRRFFKTLASGESIMKFRIGFVSNSSASSFLVTDKTLDLDAVKKRFAQVLDDISSFLADFDIIDENFMSDPHNHHLDLPFLTDMLRELDDEYDRKHRELCKLFSRGFDYDKNYYRNEKNLKRLYYEKKQKIVEKYIQTDAFKKKYKGMIYFYAFQCFEEESLDEKLGDIGRYIAVEDPYSAPNGFGPDREDDDEDDEWGE